MKLSAAARIGLAVALFISLVQISSALDWSLDTRLTSDISWDNAPSIVQADDGKVWVAWHTDRNLAEGGGMDIYYKFLDGLSWSPEMRLTTDAQNDMNPSITQAVDGKIWVVWETDRKLLDEDIYYRVFDGVSWSSDTPICTELYPDKNPSVTQTSDGKIWVVWSSIRTGDPEIFYKTYDGSSWSAEQQLTNDQNMDDEDPAIMQAMDGRIWMVWSKKSRAKNTDIYYKVFDGGEWSDDTQLTSDTYDDSNPSLMQSMNGRIWVTWSSNRKASNTNVYYKIFDGIAWTSDVQLTNAMEDDKTPSITQTMNGSIWITWASKRVLAQYDIYYRLGLELHDIAILGITPWAPYNSTIAFRNEVVNIDVGIQNDGEAIENVEVGCYTNSSLIETKTVSLPSGQYRSIVFRWNTTGVAPGFYVISAHAVPVVGELDLADNSFTDGSVEVRIGDIAGVYNGVVQPIPDRGVDGADFGITIGHFGHTGPDWLHPAWDPICDVNEDWIVDLDDIMLVGIHYGETY
jgi:hypothetical protein